MKRLLPFAFLVLAGNLCEASQEPPQIPQIETKQQAESRVQSKHNAEKKKDSASNSLSITPIIPGNTTNKEFEAKSTKRGEEESEFWPSFYGKRLKVTDTLLAAFTFLLFIATVALYWATRSLVKRADDTAKRQLRAYVFVADVQIINIDTNAVQAAITIRNTGQTPAYSVTVSTKARAFNIPGEIVFETTPVGPDSNRLVFGPDGLACRNIPLHTILDCKEAVAALKSGKGVLYIYGEILYKDTFGESRYTRFRHMIGGSVSWPSDNRMPLCPDGNEAD